MDKYAPGEVTVFTAEGTGPFYFDTLAEGIAFAENTCLECRVYPDFDAESPVLDQWAA